MVLKQPQRQEVTDDKHHAFRAATQAVRGTAQIGTSILGGGDGAAARGGRGGGVSRGASSRAGLLLDAGGHDPDVPAAGAERQLLVPPGGAVDDRE